MIRTWPEEEAVDIGTARLAEAADGRGHPRRGAAQQRQRQDPAAAAWRAAEERAGRPPVRAADLHVAAQGLTAGARC